MKTTRVITRSFPSRQRGAGLIEVLVAVLVMGVGLLGIAAMQTTALRNSQSSLERSQSVVQTYSILEAMRANRADAVAGAYNTNGWMCAVPAGGTPATNDRAAWITSLKATMGVAGDTTTCGQIACANTGACTITVRWDDQRASDGPSIAGSSTRDVVTRTQL
jgi:type IV pilus assembly protein PilV